MYQSLGYGAVPQYQESMGLAMAQDYYFGAMPIAQDQLSRLGLQLPLSPSTVVQHNPYTEYVRTSSVSPSRAKELMTPRTAAAYEAHRNAVPVFSAAPIPVGAGGQYVVAPTAPTGGITPQELMEHAGNFHNMARTPNGSSYIQAAVKEGSDVANIHIIWGELEPYLVDLLLDPHGCYVLKSIMECLPMPELQRVMSIIASDEQLCFSICTHSLHTRRVAQFLLDNEPTTLCTLLASRCREIGMTQQGCIVMQKAMDVATGLCRAPLFDAIYHNLVDFAMDPFANYIVQHLLEVGSIEENSARFVEAFSGRFFTLACNKFSSNVMEKCLFHLSHEAQHEMITQLYNVTEEEVFQMLQDSFGNYIIQSSIALASIKDIWMINEKLKPVLQRTPYGHKIESRLERRLKGKPVSTRAQATQGGNNNNTVNNAPSSRHTHGGGNPTSRSYHGANEQPYPRGRRVYPNNNNSNNARGGAHNQVNGYHPSSEIPAAQEPW